MPALQFLIPVKNGLSGRNFDLPTIATDSTNYETRMKAVIVVAKGLKRPNYALIAGKCRVSHPTLSSRARGITRNRYDAHATQQLLDEGQVASLVAWCKQMEGLGFPIHYGLLREMAAVLSNEENSEIEHAAIDQNWHIRFLE